jgi:aminopeptidase N
MTMHNKNNRNGTAHQNMHFLLALFAGLLTLVPSTMAAPSLFAPPSRSEQRQYAPSREINIIHLALDVTPNFQQRSVQGQATLVFKPIAKPLAELKLDAIDLHISSIRAEGKSPTWHTTADKLIISFEPPLSPDREVTVTITYSAYPKEGLFFRTPEMGYNPTDLHLFTQGEAIMARSWYPCYDAPNEKFTSEITCRVPDNMVVLSNGRKMSSTKDATTGLVAVRWLQDKPHVNYLISLVAGHFKALDDRYRDLPLAFWTTPSAFSYASNSFSGTRDMMAFFEQEIGVPYPWARYDQVCVQDFVAGGMENTSMTTLREETLFTPAFEDLRSSQGLVAHELAHQWFGDLVTCKDWSHLWLNEGFATYYEHLYDGHLDGQEELQHRLLMGARAIIAHPDQTNAIFRRDFVTPSEQFNHLNYGKGAWVLHMLRSQLGADIYRKCIKTYLERHAYGNVVTEDLNRVIEEISGRSFDRFFDQWVFHASQPELQISYEWIARTKMAKVTVRQEQKISEQVLLFEVPLPLRFQCGTNTWDHTIVIRQKSEDFYFSLPSSPTIVRVDPELTVLAKTSFQPSLAMLYQQLENRHDMLGRLLAVEQLGERQDRGSVFRLKKTLLEDPSHGVREAASKALRNLGTDEAFAALCDARTQKDSRVRRQVITDIGGFHRASAFDTLLQNLKTEINPDIQSTILKALAAYHRPEIRPAILATLNQPSFRQTLANGAIAAMRIQDDPAYLPDLLTFLQAHGTEFTSTDFAQALDTLARLARDQERRDNVREFLLQHVENPKRKIQLAAITALGTLGDPKASGTLDGIAALTRPGPEKGLAEKALERIRSVQKQAPELGTLRTELMSLQKDNRELRQNLEDLKKRFDTLFPASTAQPKKTKATEK